MRTTTAWSSGEELVGLEYVGPFDDAPAQEGIVHRVIPWDEVVLDEGTGIVHIAPGAGAEDFELSRVHGLDVLVPIDESGRMLPGFGPAEGSASDEAADVIIEDLRRRELLVDSGVITHRYPTCWRCGTPLVFRVVDDWFIACDEIRQPMLDANATVQWTPDFYSKRMDDWLRNMGDWNISRKRYFGLPLPFYPCDCGELNVVGSRDELVERATAGVDQLQELHRPWIDEVTICVRRVREGRPAGSRRSATPGSTRASSRSRRSAGTTPSGSSTATRPERPRACPERTCPTTPTGSSGSRRTGSRRCESRSGSGSTRSRSCR